MGKRAPKAPDPWETAAAQGAWNSFTAQQQQAMNMIGQNTPWGTLDYQQTGSTWITDPTGKRIEVPTYTANVNLSPEQQAIFERTQAAEGNLAQIAQDQSEWLGDYLKEPFEFTNRDAEEWAWDLAAPRILQQQQQNEQALRTRLINSGLRPGTAAWDAEMTRLTNANTDQLNQLALTGRQMAFNEALAKRNQPLNEIIGLMSGTQVQNPNATFAPTPQVGVGGVDYTGLVNQKYQADMANYRAGMGGLFGLGSALIGALPFSDRRLKTDIRRVGMTDGGVPVYTYRYKGDSTVHMGVMAQDVPEARVKDPSGFFRVDYSRVR